MRKLNEYILEVCEEKGITYTEGKDPWLIRLEKGGLVRYIVESDLGINSSVANKLCVDKSRCYEVLTLEKVPAVPHYFFGNTYGVKNYTGSSQLRGLIDRVEASGYPVVVKDNLGGSGELVFLVRNGKELDQAVSELLVRGRDIAVSPYVDYEREYRVTVLDGEVIFSYVKVRGGGNWQHNLSKGSTVDRIDGNREGKVHQVALQASKALGIRFSNIDVVEVDGEYKVLEANSSVSLTLLSESGDSYSDVARTVYRSALGELFGESKNRLSQK